MQTKWSKNHWNFPSDWKCPICDEVIEFHRHRKTIEKPLFFTFGLKIVVIVSLFKLIIFKSWPTEVYKSNKKTIVFSLRIENVTIKIILNVIVFINIVIMISWWCLTRIFRMIQAGLGSSYGLGWPKMATHSMHDDRDGDDDDDDDGEDDGEDEDECPCE